MDELVIAIFVLVILYLWYSSSEHKPVEKVNTVIRTDIDHLNNVNRRLDALECAQNRNDNNWFNFAYN